MQIGINQYRIPQNSKIDLTDIPTQDRNSPPKRVIRDEMVPQLRPQLRDWQEKLYAENKQSLLIVLQAMDAGGKDGLIKHVMASVNPQGVHVASFKQPSLEELDRDYLWRINRALPRPGEIGIFNRSHYEDVIITRVHNLIPNENFPAKLVDKDIWKKRFRQICDYERYLCENGYQVVKIFLHISKEEQRQRLLDRLNEPDKLWKFSSSDIKEREHWEEYQKVLSEMISATSTEHAPWYVLPADKKWWGRFRTMQILIHHLEMMDPKYPKPSEEFMKNLDYWRKLLDG